MAIYNFHCVLCRKDFEVIATIGTEVTSCPVCQAICERDHTPVKNNFNLVGHCWARTNYETKEQVKHRAKQNRAEGKRFE